MPVRPEVFKKLYEVIKHRAKTLNKEYIGAISNGVISKNNTAVYGTVSNQSIHFCFIDFNYNEITFNNYFVDKGKFPEAHAFCDKELRKLKK